MNRAAVAVPAGGWPLWAVQARAVVRLELARRVSPRSLWLLFVAFAPALIIGVHSLHDRSCNLQTDTLVLASILQLFYVRFAIFFGCLGTAVGALRGEVAEKTLHYPFLAPIRREVLMAGKFVAGVLTTAAVFGAAVLTCFSLMYGHFAAGRAFVLEGAGLRHLGAYLVLAALACVGYSAVFLVFSLLFKNPILPSMLFLLWEMVNGVLPAWLKHLSVTFYLKPLFPVELRLGGLTNLFTIVAEPIPPWLAVSGLLAFALAVLAFACWRIRGFEISYSAD